MTCDELTWVPIGIDGRSTCVRCGEIELWSRRTVFALCGASGAGKSTLVAPLQSRLPQHVVYDSDLLLGRWTDDWDAHFELVLRTAAMIGSNDRHAVVAGSVFPERLDPLPSRDLVGDIVYVHLDCTDVERRRRLTERPSWRQWDEARIAEANAFAERCRAVCDVTVDTTGRTVDDVADEVASVIRERSTG